MEAVSKLKSLFAKGIREKRNKFDLVSFVYLLHWDLTDGS